MREQPFFCLVLFDEIEKAHPRILDKFLQILEDGRLTDGRGETAYFSEAIIVFTSNLGVPELDPNQPVPTGSLLETTVRRAIEHEFEVTIKRPELLGRIGDNIVVFDYIDPGTAEELAGLFLDNVLTQATTRTGVGLTIEPGVREQVVRLVTADLSKGGRGITRAVESTLVNPLARALFARPAGQRTATISGLDADGGRMVRDDAELTPPAGPRCWRRSPCSARGPGSRSGCRGAGSPARRCASVDTWDPAGGAVLPVAQAADLVVEQVRDLGLDGITISGGEPTDQGAALTALLDQVRRALAPAGPRRAGVHRPYARRPPGPWRRPWSRPPTAWCPVLIGRTGRPPGGCWPATTRSSASVRPTSSAATEAGSPLRGPTCR